MASDEPTIGTPVRFGRYTVIAPLGRGGMGAVYLARDEVLGREVAVKTLTPPPQGSVGRETFRRRFGNEARALAQLAHPNVVRVFDAGFEGELPFLVMEVVRGPSLAARITEDGPLAPDEVRRLGAQIARALAAAHDAGIVHRDVKPSNVLEVARGQHTLADFGVAHLPDSSLTLVGQFVGTAAYAAPEAILTGSSGPSADVWSLGATLFEALTGRSPLGDAATVNEAAAAHRKSLPLVPTLRAGVPAELVAAVERALQRDVARRPTAKALAEELERAEPTLPPSRILPPPRRRRALGWAIGLAVAAVLATGVTTYALRGGGAAPTRAQRLQRVQERVARGELRDAAAELDALVREDPADEASADWLARLRAVAPGP